MTLEHVTLEHADAVGDGRRGDAELLAGMGEALVPGGGFEEAQAVEGRQGYHKLGHGERCGPDYIKGDKAYDANHWRSYLKPHNSRSTMLPNITGQK